MKTYGELMSLPTYEERFQYLQEGIAHSVGAQTFGSLRYTNQILYSSAFWKNEVRPRIIVRDGACDLAVPERVIANASLIRIHHINPLTPEMFDEDNPLVVDPNNLITMSYQSHQALTYGAPPPQQIPWAPRTPFDHIPWKIRPGKG